MKKLSLLLLAASAPFAAVAAQPGTSSSESPAATTEASEPAATPAEQAERPAPAERRICRRIDSTGSRTAGQRVCMTAEQWRRADM